MTDAPTDHQQQQAPPAAPLTATDAQAQLNVLTGDKAWVDRLMNGEAAAVNEYRTLIGDVVGGGSADDVVASVMEGKAPAFGNSEQRQMAVVVEKFRELGIDDGVAKQFLSGQKVTPQEYQAVAGLKRELMGDSEWVSRFMAGGVKERKQMTTINAVLVNGVNVEQSA